MPVREGLIRTEIPGEKELRAELVAEYNAPKDSGEPMIIIERPYLNTIHLYVIWSKWEGFHPSVCSRIILDAFKTANGEKAAEMVTVAMPLVDEAEAKRLGVI